MYPFPRRRIAGVAGVLLALGAVPALAGVAGTGTAEVAISLNSQTLAVTADFASQPGDLPGNVNLGVLDPFEAGNVALSNVNFGTGASFSIPFTSPTDSFRAVGDLACPASGCASLVGAYGFVGFLDMIDLPQLPPDLLYTFDGSLGCVGSAGSIICEGPFALNYFAPADVATGAEVTIPGTHRFFDPRLQTTRSFDTRITFSNVTSPGDLAVAFFSRLRGAIPQPYLTSTDGFEAIYFDIATGAIFTEAEVCVVVDADRNGVVDGTATAVSRLAGLHFVGNAFVLENIRIDDTLACLTVSSLSPFALVAAPAGGTTSTTTTVPGSSTTTTTTTAATSSTTTSTTIPPCSSARACLAEAKADVECPEGLPAALGNLFDKKVRAATAKLGQADSKPTKATKLAKQARTLLRAIDKKAAALAKKKRKGISAACRQGVADALAPVLRELDAGRL